MRISEELRDRTKRFASGVVGLYAGLPTSRREVEVLAHQLLRSGTSVAANVREASRARSDAEFVSKIEIVLQEIDESQLWLELLREDCALTDRGLIELHKETHELLAIFVTIVTRVKRAKA